MDRASIFWLLWRDRIPTPLTASSQAHVTNHIILTIYNSSLLWLQWDPQTLHILLPSNRPTTSAQSREELSGCQQLLSKICFPHFHWGLSCLSCTASTNGIRFITQLHKGGALKWHAGRSGSTGSGYKQGHSLPFPGRTLSIIPCLLPPSLEFMSVSVTSQLRSLLTLFRNDPLFIRCRPA